METAEGADNTKKERKEKKKRNEGRKGGILNVNIKNVIVSFSL